jgi:hypothetical protein
MDVGSSIMTPQKLSPTANGSDVAVFDFDGDGKLDLYFATGNVLPLSAGPDARNRLYKNLGGGRFRTRRSAPAFGADKASDDLRASTPFPGGQQSRQNR